MPSPRLILSGSFSRRLASQDIRSDSIFDCTISGDSPSYWTEKAKAVRLAGVQHQPGRVKDIDNLLFNFQEVVRSDQPNLASSTVTVIKKDVAKLLFATDARYLHKPEGNYDILMLSVVARKPSAT